MKILVTGLCLQGNKGGPAIALSLKKRINNAIPTAEFTLSVPPGEEFFHEKKWSKKYEINVIEQFVIKDFLPPFCFQKFPSRIQRFLRWLKALSQADIVIEMSAISYVGPPVSSALFDYRWFYFIFAKLFRRPFLAWTQSYGPFSTPLIRFLARWDLNNQPVIFCRGENCLSNVRRLLPKKQALSFPDVAVDLEYDRNWGREYIGNLIGEFAPERLVTISPSSVIYSKHKLVPGQNLHIEHLSELCRYLAAKGLYILFVPHVYRPGRHRPEICDYAVSRIVVESLSDIEQLGLISDDLSPVELKSVISNATLHIGARYHSIIAALSSGVPCISLSWHPKYTDIMQMYGQDRFVFDEVSSNSLNSLYALVEEALKRNNDIRSEIIVKQRDVVAEVQRNTDLFTRLMMRFVR